MFDMSDMVIKGALISLALALIFFIVTICIFSIKWGGEFKQPLHTVRDEKLARVAG